ncbi:TetR/AcrR family transcriptional regulator [Konateibacter massiliensis]|uniref:TetR/AcrR family transcriptional regulator n=1 Tax=Konateibacter massiliensis TaxID=2002841 RepID=UPI0015D4F9C3|nr:TetR/AcrR family transcriptional regulator [Konateibacter massiliensis]
MYKKQTSAIAIKSQRWIADSLIRLLENYSFSEITITQICQEANLVRKTFYRNFESKEDVLHYVLDELFGEFQQKNEISAAATFEIFTHYYEFWASEKQLLTYLHRDGLFYLLNQKYIEYADSIRMYLLQANNDIQTGLEPYAIRFIAGGMVAILEHWLVCGFDESIDSLTKLTETLLLSANVYLNSSCRR